MTDYTPIKEIIDCIVCDLENRYNNNTNIGTRNISKAISKATSKVIPNITQKQKTTVSKVSVKAGTKKEGNCDKKQIWNNANIN